MSKVLKIGNIKWTMGKGAQALLIPTMGNDRMFKIVHHKQGHGWAILKENQIINLVENTNSFICEVLASYPKKVYFDVDCGEPDKLQLDDVITIIKKYFGDVELAISGSEEQTKKSYHITIPSMIISNKNELEDLKKLVIKIKKTQCEYFDWKVYTKNRAMKCIFQSKPQRQKQMIIQDDNKEHHFINSFFTGNESKFEYIKDNEDVFNDETDIKELVCIDKSLKNLVLPKDFTTEDLEDSFKLLQLAKSEKSLPHSYTWKVALFCYWNGLTFNQFWDWAKTKDDSEERKNKWKNTHWETIGKQEYKMSKSGMCKLLSFHYPQLNIIKKDLKTLNTKSFLDSFNLPSTKIDKLLEMKHFETEHKCVIFNIGMGGGKTSMTVEYLEKTNKSFVWLTPRISLVMNTYQRFEDKKMDVYNYKKEGGKKQEQCINKANKLMISCESLHKLENTKKFDVVIIDEIETLLCSWDSETHGKNINTNWEKFKELITNSKKVILLDAFTTTKTISFMNDMKVNDIITYTSDAKPKEKILDQHLTYDSTVNNIIKDLDSGKKLYVFYAFKGNGKKHDSIEALRNKIIMKCKGKPNIMVYHGDMSDKDRKSLYNVKEEWEKYDCIITTSSITVGVNYEGSKFDKVYLMMSGLVNNIRDVIQSSMRIRNPNENIMDIFFFDTLNKDIINYGTLFMETDDIIYKNLINNVILERQSDFEATFLKFCSLTNYTCLNGIQENIRCKNESEAIDCKILVPYESLEAINDFECERLEHEKIYKMEASMVEKFQVQKYFFDIKFRHLDEDNRAFIWNMNLKNYFENINCELVQKIKADNNVNLLSELNTSDMKISDATNDWIKENYAVNEANIKSKNQKVAKLLNSKLGCEVISISYHGKTSSYHIGEFTKDLEELEDMIKWKKEKEAKEKLIKWEEEHKKPNPLDFGIDMD